MRMQQQRVINNTPIITVPVVPCITNAPPFLQAQNPTAKHTLKDPGSAMHNKCTTIFTSTESNCKTYPQRHSVLALTGNTEQYTRRHTKDKQATYKYPCAAGVSNKTNRSHSSSRSPGGNSKPSATPYICTTGHKCFNHPRVGNGGYNIHILCTHPI